MLYFFRVHLRCARHNGAIFKHMGPLALQWSHSRYFSLCFPGLHSFLWPSLNDVEFCDIENVHESFLVTLYGFLGFCTYLFHTFKDWFLIFPQDNDIPQQVAESDLQGNKAELKKKEKKAEKKRFGFLKRIRSFFSKRRN